MKATIDQVYSGVQNYFVSHGYSRDTAEGMSDNLIEAELFGKSTHGLVRVPWVIANNIPNPYISLESSQLHPNTINFLDATNLNGYVSCDKVVEKMIELLDRDDCKFVVSVLKSAFPSSILLRYLKKFYKHRMIALVLGTTPRLVSDAEKVPNIFGTNPIGYTFPVSGNRVLISDFSTSDIPLGKVLMTHQGNEGILQAGKLLDKNGDITDSTHNAFSDDGRFIGSLLPFGGGDGMHKGMMISLFIELVTAYLSGNRSDKGDLVLVGAKADLISGGQKGIDELIAGATNRGGLKRLPGEASMQKYQLNRDSGLIEVPSNIAKLIGL